LAVIGEIFPLDGAEICDRGLFKSSLNLGCKSHAVTVRATL